MDAQSSRVGLKTCIQLFRLCLERESRARVRMPFKLHGTPGIAYLCTVAARPAVLYVLYVG